MLGKKISYLDLHIDIYRCEDIQDSIPAVLLNLVVYDEHQGWVPSPYRACFPYWPTLDIDKNTIWSDCVDYLPGVLNSHFFRREKTYRSVFRRHLKELRSSGFSNYNTVMSRYLSRIAINDLPKHNDFVVIAESLKAGRPIYNFF